MGERESERGAREREIRGRGTRERDGGTREKEMEGQKRKGDE